MSHSFKKLLHKLQDYFFGKEIDSYKQPTIKEDKTTNSIGRIESDERVGETKIIHQYPKQGQFRFPVIEDKTIKHEKRITKTSNKHREEKTRSVNKESKQEQTKERSRNVVSKPIVEPGSVKPSREKFTGQNFKASTIPSPIYGFGKREQSNEKYPLHSSMENPMQESTNGFNVVEQKTIVDSRAIRQEFELEEAKAIFEEEVIAIPELVDVTEEIVHESTKEIDVVEEVIESSKVIEEEDSSPEHLDIIIDEEQQSHYETQPLEEEFEEQSITEEVKEEQQQKHDVLKAQERKDPFENSNRVIIPYNVLMYKKDKEKVATHSTKEKIETDSTIVRQEGTNDYQFPSITLLDIPPASNEDDTEWLNEQRQLLVNTLENFHVSAKVIDVKKGPSVTRFEVQPDLGVKVSKITNLTDDIKLSLAAKDIRIEAPIPGRNAIGIEVPNKTSSPVGIRQIIRSKEFQSSTSPLTIVMGLDISGNAIVTDIQKMPHGLIAGATGSGKSVCINSILISLMFKAKPEEVKLILIDPKMVELAPYNEIPHLISPVITDAKQATLALKWVVEEMERRYELFAQSGVRDIKRYNHIHSQEGYEEPALPYIVVVIDELADLMMVSPQDVEESICRIAQKARACGIHLLLATQRPSVDVITGLIKANIPTRIAFSVSSQVDSRTIIDSSGAERLLGKGDMLFLENGSGKPIRVQGNFVSDDEIDRVIDFVKKQGNPDYLFTKDQLIKNHAISDQEDELFEEACYYVIEQEVASASSIQRRFRVGFNRAARLIEMMEQQGIVSEAMGSKPRNVLVTRAEFEEQQGLMQTNE